MSDRISLVRWRDAKTDPPNHERYVWTDEGQAVFFGRLWITGDGYGTPTMWCDPMPPTQDALSFMDLDLLAVVVSQQWKGETTPAIAARRLRVTLDLLAVESE